ncbi:MAG TPA: FAD-binding oxidoreductase [Terriglobia bacterium]|nr:FAD-binding oxidoreductase [Terriglobia bacterium]
MMTGLESVQTEFAAIVGGDRVAGDDAACNALAVAGRVPRFAIYPRMAEQVAAALKCTADHNLAVIPSRNATKLGIGNIPARYDVALSLKEMNNVWHYEPEDLTATVEAGMKLGDLQRMLCRHRLWLPLDPQGGARASVGGILAANASGPLRLLYGAPRDMIVGMTIATTEGKIIKAGGRVVKNVAGYDLTKLLIGSFGTLGVIVEAHLKLFPLPAGRATCVFELANLEAARDLRKRIVNSPLTPMRMVLLNSEAQAMVAQGAFQRRPDAQWTLWVEAGGSEKVLQRYARELEEFGRVAGAPIVWLENQDAERGWERISNFHSCPEGDLSVSMILKGAFPIAHVEDFVLRAHQEADRLKSRRAVYAQVGSGVVHVCFLNPSESSTTLTLIQSLRTVAKELRGSLVIERCDAEIKRQIDVWDSPGIDFEIMGKVKQAWDPKGILSPGRFVGRL